MTEQLAFLTDVPDLATFAWPEGGPADVPDDAKPPTSRIQVGRTGRFAHPRYGKFAVSKTTFDSFIRNFAAGLPTPELPGDFDHAPETGGGSAACGWLKGLHADGDKLFATVEWNWEGAYAIREGRYRYISPTWSLDWIDDEGEKRGPTLLAFALTNRPFFSRMATVSLSQTFSRDTFTGDGEPAVEESPDSRPRPPMSDTLLPQLAAIFSLGEDATDAQVLAAAHAALANQIPEGSQPITATRLAELERASKIPPGHEVVAGGIIDGLQERANKADRFEKELGELKFETAFAETLSEGRATPHQKHHYRQLFDKDQGLAIDMLREALPQVLTSARGAGSRGIDEDFGAAGDGVDEDRHDLDRRVHSYMRTHQLPEDKYLDALHAVVAEESR